MNLAFIVNNLGVSEQNYQIINLVEKINKTTNHFFSSINVLLCLTRVNYSYYLMKMIC
jgi:hypothetical protein